MLQQAKSLKEKIIDNVTTKTAEKLDDNQVDICSKFIRKFYGTVALNDLEDRNVEDLFGSALSFWNYIYKRQPHQETKLRIYNPDYERHGWQSTHTVIEIIHEDMPFLVDSLSMEINRLGLTTHLIIHVGDLSVKRDKQGYIKQLEFNSESTPKGYQPEAPIYIEINRQTDPESLDRIKENLQRVLTDVQMSVNDWGPMCEKITGSIKQLENAKRFLDKEELSESIDFLQWIQDHHFTFLGIRDYELIEKGGEPVLRPVVDSGMGILSDKYIGKVPVSLLSRSPAAQQMTLSNQILIISKTNQRSTVHRPIYMDYLGIKLFDAKGKVIGERAFVGLYTHDAYHVNPIDIPFLRRNVAQVMKKSGFSYTSHSGKALLNILETLPRDELFQATADDLLEMSMGVLQMQERRIIRLFARKDVYHRFISCLVFVPRERFNTELRREMEKVLLKEFRGKEIEFSTRFSESVLARIHFLVRIDPKDEHDIDFRQIEKKLVEVGRSWEDDLKTHIIESFGEEQGNIYANRYANAFSASYREYFSPRTAVYDIRHMEQLTDTRPLEMNFYRPVGVPETILRFKIYQYDHTLALSDVLPILENMGLHVISERPYEIVRHDGRCIWVNDFSMIHAKGDSLNLDTVKEIFQEAFAKIWFGKAENDGFNKLILTAGLTWREVSVLRAYAKYLRQVRFTFSQEYIESTMENNSEIANKLSALFLLKFKPGDSPTREQDIVQLEEAILQSLDSVANLDEDRILRRYLNVLHATLRTNYFQRDIHNKEKEYLSLKLNPQLIPDLPLPLPMFEIFVYSPRFEGVHLRAGKVARGGLRWSDRREDFRTEVLGLMKAQVVKNAVIVPSGAKGGFIPKALPAGGDRDAILEEAKYCYRGFIRGLLDISDNIIKNEIIRPQDVVIYDEDDPYLVVAADKGTATFSDIANEISNEYNFWLGDAFASGGSEGYDHKKMGITAKGAWESVKRLFRELGRDIQTSPFTAIGVGDMAGDVFGNGMLLSRQTKLVGAFNHLHIFLDPDPDIEVSFKERERLFALARSSWEDYDETLISKGGGIFNRHAKSIKLTAEIKQLLDLKQDFIVPNELIQAMLRAPIDLLWNGGIGTFVKAPTESDIDVGDRSNDNIRINSNELRCKVIGEGGNLGFTQLARVEYTLQGGMIYSDFIDNSAGVDCSDHEVNIKILLNKAVADGDLTEKQRNQLLIEMTDEVAEHVLYNNYQQTQAISLTAAQSAKNVELHSRYIQDLEKEGKLVRSLEFLPDEKVLMERKLAGQGLTRPGIGILLSHSKILAKEAILQSDLPEDPYLSNVLVEAFPKPLREKFKDAMSIHSLRREIIATQLSNTMFNEMGFTFVYRLQDETGAPVSSIVRAYTIVRNIFNLVASWRGIEALDNKIPAQEQVAMMMQLIRLIRRSTRWVLRTRRMNLDIASTIQRYKSRISELKECLPEVLGKKERENFDTYFQRYQQQGVPQELAHDLACTRSLFSALDIIEAAEKLSMTVEDVANVYFAIGERLKITWVRGKVIAHPPENHWDALSREALRDDLDWQQRALTVGILRHKSAEKDVAKRIEAWEQKYSMLIRRWRSLLIDLRAATTLNITMFLVAVRELLDLTQTSIQHATEAESKHK